MEFRHGEHGGYFWGPGREAEGLAGKPVDWPKPIEKKSFTSKSIQASLAPKYQDYYTKLAIGQPANWKCDQRTKDLFCLSQWINDEIESLNPVKNVPDNVWDVNEEIKKTARRKALSYFNRKARSEDDLYELAARTMNLWRKNELEADVIRK